MDPRTYIYPLLPNLPRFEDYNPNLFSNRSWLLSTYTASFYQTVRSFHKSTGKQRTERYNKPHLGLGHFLLFLKRARNSRICSVFCLLWVCPEDTVKVSQVRLLPEMMISQAWNLLLLLGPIMPCSPGLEPVDSRANSMARGHSPGTTAQVTTDHRLRLCGF